MRGPVLPQYQAAIRSSFATDAEGAGHPVLPAFVCARKGSGSEGSETNMFCLVLQETSIALLLAQFHGFRCPPQVLSEMQYSEFDWAAVASLPTQLQRLCIAHVNLDFDARQTAGAPPFPHSSPHTGPRSSTTIRVERIFLKPFARASSVLERIAVHQVSGLQLMHCLLAC